MGRRPWRPEQLDLLASGHRDVGLARRGGDMADDVGVGVLIGSDEADAGVLGNGPASNDGCRGRVRIRCGVVALIIGVADFDLCHVLFANVSTYASQNRTSVGCQNLRRVQPRGRRRRQ